MKHTTFFLSILLITALAIACEEQANQQQESFVDEKITQLRAIYAPDKRVAIFSISPVASGSRVVLKGETNMAQAKTALLDSLRSRQISFTDSIAVLPASDLEGKVFGLVNNSVANIRSEPKHSAELATQALLGTPLNVLRQTGEWYLVQTPDLYISWVDHGGLVTLDQRQFESWKGSEKVIYTKITGFSFSEASTTSQVVTDLVMGDVLVKTGESQASYEVKYPDGRKAYVSKSESQPTEAWLANASPSGENLTGTAFSLMGAPYLWGGTSSKGMDCSGFTKTVYFMNGLVIPRDASQQVFAGEPVDTSEGWDNLQPGDLLFFGSPATADKKERVVHVGMWGGNSRFIHSSGQVRVSSVDPHDELFDEYNTERFLRARRYAPSFEGSILELKKDLIY